MKYLFLFFVILAIACDQPAEEQPKPIEPPLSFMRLLDSTTLVIGRDTVLVYKYDDIQVIGSGYIYILVRKNEGQSVSIQTSGDSEIIDIPVAAF